MYPILIKIGPVTIYAHGVFVALGFVAGILLALSIGQKDGIPKGKIHDMVFYIFIAAIAGSRLFFILTQLEYYTENPLDIVKIWEGGLVFYGGLLFAVPVLFIYLKKNALPVWKTLDVFAPSLAIGHAIGRIGCFFAGSCYGKPTDLPWGVVFNDPNSPAIKGIPLHPTQLYESFAEAGIFIFLMILRRHKIFDGQIMWTYILLYSAARFIIEFFRGDRIRGFIYGDFSIAQGISVVLFFVAVIFLLYNRRGKTE